MKKIAYKNKLYKKREPAKGGIPSATNSEEDYSANFPNIGRGYSMPGEQAIPISNSDEIIMLKERRKRKHPPTNYKDMLDLFVELGNQMDQDEEHDLASFADFLITKIAEQKNNNYELLLKDLVVSVSNSDLLNKNSLIISLGRLYNKRYLELLEQYDDQDAHREAYQEVSLFAEKNMASRSNEPLAKEAQILESNPVYVAEQIASIIKIMINNMSPDVRQRSFANVKNKISEFNVMEISNKRAPGGAAIGVSLGLIKNILNGKDPYFINTVLSELSIRL